MARAGLFHLVFADPTHKVHNTIPGKCWQEKGRKGTLIIPSNTGRKRVTILGFINVINFDFISLVTESNCDMRTAKTAHRELRKHYDDGKEILIIQDNAPYHHALASSGSFKKMLITPVFLPPYSPNLNLIERVWKFMKKKIMKNTYYPTFNDFWKAIIEFCGNLEKYMPEIKTIMSQKFQILEAA